MPWADHSNPEGLKQTRITLISKASLQLPESSDLGDPPPQPSLRALFVVGGLVMVTLGVVAGQSLGIGTHRERRASHVAAEADRVLSPSL